MAIRRIRAFCVVTLLVGLASASMASDPLRVEIEPAFDGASPQVGVIPVAAEIWNTGPDARGVLRVSTDESNADYPVDLPRGAHRRVITYPRVSYGGVRFSLQTDQGNVDKEFPIRASNFEGHRLLLISDAPGQLAFIASRVAKSGQYLVDDNQGLLDCYSKPGASPTRPVGYCEISTIILGAGAEKLTDEEVQAIKLWVVTGGLLVFVGGGPSPVLEDRRWSDILPARDFHPAELLHSRALFNLTNMEPPTFRVTTGRLAKGATGTYDGSILVWCSKSYGMGKTTYLAFDPFSAPFNKWPGRREVLTRQLVSNEAITTGRFLQNYAVAETKPDAVTGQGYLSGRSTLPLVHTGPGFPNGPPRGEDHIAPIVRTPVSVESDPFSMTLPPTERILGILLTYFVFVVPINFLVLKKFKRGELAWFTAPVISLVFAGILFQSAASLYRAKMSTVSSGIIVAQEGDPEGIFVGNSQMFIPRAGSYDLNLSGVDMLGTVPSQERGARPQPYSVDSDYQDLDAIDVGEIDLPKLQANNLTFKDIAYRQRVPIGRWLHVTLRPTGDEKASCEVVNVGPYLLRNAEVVYGGIRKSIGDLLPGQRLTVPVSFDAASRIVHGEDEDPSMFITHGSRVALTGVLEGFRPGPQIGQDVPGRSSVTVALFSSWQGGSL